MGRKVLLVLGVTAAVWTGVAQGEGVSYSGILSRSGTNADGRLFVAGPQWNWAGAEVTLGWTADNMTTPGLWHYVYTLTVPDTDGCTDLQCAIVETSDGRAGQAFSAANLFSVASAPGDWLDTTRIALFAAGSEPGLPRDLYGVEFCTLTADPITLTISFDSDRAPVWGDLYARSFVECDEPNVLYNEGMLAANPAAAPGDDSVTSHVLVPDTVANKFVVPVPGAVLLGGTGFGLVEWLRRRKQL